MTALILLTEMLASQLRTLKNALAIVGTWTFREVLLFTILQVSRTPSLIKKSSTKKSMELVSSQQSSSTIKLSEVNLKEKLSLMLSVQVSKPLLTTARGTSCTISTILSCSSWKKKVTPRELWL